MANDIVEAAAASPETRPPSARRATQATPAELATAALDIVPMPIWVLRSDLAIDFANAAAAMIMDTAAWLHSAAGRLVRIGEADFRALCAAPAELVTSVRLAGAGSPRQARVVLRFAPLIGEPACAAAWPEARSLLVLEPPEPDRLSARLAQLARSCQLTPSEALVLRRLAAGLRVGDIAVELGITSATVRAHLRALFSKTGLNRQAELVRLVLAD